MLAAGDRQTPAPRLQRESSVRLTAQKPAGGGGYSVSAVAGGGGDATPVLRQPSRFFQQQQQHPEQAAGGTALAFDASHEAAPEDSGTGDNIKASGAAQQIA